MPQFEKVKRFENIDLPLPTRATSHSAGYDFAVAEDIVIPPYDFLFTKARDKAESGSDFFSFTKPLSLDTVAAVTKQYNIKPTLVPTGIKCRLGIGQYLELSMRSSMPLKYWLIMANSEGIIDQDYYGNESNDGEIFFQLINLFPFAIELKKGDKIGQGIIKSYGLTDDDNATGIRTGGFGSTSPEAMQASLT